MAHRASSPKNNVSRKFTMPSFDYRIESSHPIVGRFLPASSHAGCLLLMSDRALAVVIAAKSESNPIGQEIRVVHVPSGDVIFRKTASAEHKSNLQKTFDDT
jgi:hypothetical protein